MRQITANRSAALLLATLLAALLLCGCVESDDKSTDDGPVEITFETTAPAPQVSEQTTQAPEETTEPVLSLPAVPEHILIGSGGESRMFPPPGMRNLRNFMRRLPLAVCKTAHTTLCSSAQKIRR